MKAVRTLVLIANDKAGRFLENAGVGKDLTELKSLQDMPTREYSDLPGRSQAGGGAARHGFDRPADIEGLARDGFAALLLEEATGMWHEGAYDRLVMAAPPKMLGALRARLAPPLKDALSGDLNKDLTNTAVADLAGHFALVAAF